MAHIPPEPLLSLARRGSRGLLGATVIATTATLALACHPQRASVSSRASTPPISAALGQVPRQAPPKAIENPQREASDLIFVGHGSSRSPGTLQEARYVLLGVDCFGPLGDLACQELADAAGLKRGSSLEFGWTGKGVVNRIRAYGDYASVTLSPTFYPDGSAYVTLDVTSRTSPQRTLLRSFPQGNVELENNLLELYVEFTQTWMALFQKGIDVRQKSNRGYWEFQHEHLFPYAELFRSTVPKHRKALIRILEEDKDLWKRQAAAGLLGFDPNPLAAQALETALLDPETAVRSEAARALLPSVQHSIKADRSTVQLAPVLHMLRLPTTSDRSNASALLAEMSLLPPLRADILESASPTLLQMLDAQRPGADAQARLILERTTGKNLGDDPALWRNYLKDSP